MKYYKVENCELDYDSGFIYYEIGIDHFAVRQVEVYDEKTIWFNSLLLDDKGIAVNLCDQEISNEVLDSFDEISKEEFEQIWSESMSALKL